MRLGRGWGTEGGVWGRPAGSERGEGEMRPPGGDCGPQTPSPWAQKGEGRGVLGEFVGSRRFWGCHQGGVCPHQGLGDPPLAIDGGWESRAVVSLWGVRGVLMAWGRLRVPGGSSGVLQGVWGCPCDLCPPPRGLSDPLSPPTPPWALGIPGAVVALWGLYRGLNVFGVSLIGFSPCRGLGDLGAGHL